MKKTSLWPTVKLSQVLTAAKRAETPMPGTAYRQIGVRLWGEGAYEREEMDGSQTKYTQLFRAEAGDIILNKIWARNGSIAVVPPALAGCCGSGEFPMFSPHRDRIEPSWMHWLTKTPGFWAQCDEKSQGTSGKNRIKPEQFLSVEIPLPPLAEQRRIVARITALAAQLTEARELHKQSAEQTLVISDSFFSKLLRGEETRAQWPFLPLAEVAEINPRCGKKQFGEDNEVSFVPMRAVNDETGKIVAAERRTYAEVKAGYTRFEDGDVIFARITPCMQNGKSAIVMGLVNGVGFGSTEFLVARPGAEVEAKWLHYIFRHREFLDDAVAHFTGTAGQQRVPTSFIREKRVLVPPLPEQRRIVAELDALQAEVDRLKALQAATAAELDALLPAILDRAFKGEL